MAQAKRSYTELFRGTPAAAPQWDFMILESDPIISGLLLDAASDFGWAAVVTSSVRDALHAVLSEGVRVIIADRYVRTPFGVDDGWLVARAAQEVDPRIGVVFTTADHEMSARCPVQLQRRQRLLPKPFGLSDLRSTVSDLLLKRLAYGGAA